jgi:nitrous oxidase accessory protein NosD
VLFRGNHVYDNGSDGINLRGERESNAPHRNTFENNTIENNGTRNGGYGFNVNSPARDLVLRGNTFRSTGRQTQKAAIFIDQNGLMPLLENNRIEKHPEGEVISVKKENE